MLLMLSQWLQGLSPEFGFFGCSSTSPSAP